MTSHESKEGFVAFCDSKTSFDAPYPPKSKQLMEWLDGYSSAKRLWNLYMQCRPFDSRLDMMASVAEAIKGLKKGIPVEFNQKV